jgi:hypothetical protein
MNLTSERIKDVAYLRSLTNEQLLDGLIQCVELGGRSDVVEEQICPEELRNELLRRLDGINDGNQEPLDVDALPVNPITAVAYWNSLTEKIEALCNQPRILSEKEMKEIADQFLVVIDYLQQLSHPQESQIKSLLFCHNGKVSLKIDVVYGAIYLHIKDPKDQLLMLLGLPAAESQKLSHVVLSHSVEAKEPLKLLS